MKNSPTRTGNPPKQQPFNASIYYASLREKKLNQIILDIIRQ
jgi:hypothetical protein